MHPCACACGSVADSARCFSRGGGLHLLELVVAACLSTTNCLAHHQHALRCFINVETFCHLHACAPLCLFRGRQGNMQR